MKRSKHSLSHYNLLSATMGRLYPVANYEALPGDTIQHRVQALIRMAPLSAPVMHPIIARFHNFAVPYRLIWGTDWEDLGSFEEFITGGKNGDDAQVVPHITLQWVDQDEHTGSLADHLGIPFPGDNQPISVSALPFRAFILTYNEYYRDQDLVSEIATDVNTVVSVAKAEPPRVSWAKDYFTTARPWPQKGSDVTIPVSGIVSPIAGDQAPRFRIGSGNTPYPLITGQAGDSWDVRLDGSQPPEDQWLNWLDPKLKVDNIESSVNDFRRAFALQRYQEARAQYGSRYVEYLNYLGITPADSRLQRPEYLGGAKQTIQLSEVIQTAPDSVPDAYGVGDLYGHGMAALRSKRNRRFFQEHCYILSLMSVIPKPIYMNGLEREHFRKDKEDFFQKELAHIGQQTIFKGEVYADGTATDDEVLGYQDRYSEYKSLKSRVSGEFRTSLNYWHLGRDFDTHPELNASFIECSPSDRIFNVATGDKLWCMVNHSIQARRMVPRSSSSRIL